MTPAAPAPPTPVLVESVLQACAKVTAERAASPSLSLKARLERLVDFDQAGRADYAVLVGRKLSVAEHRAAKPAINCLLAKDLADQAELKAVIPPSGWLTRRDYGRKAALGAWLVVDHAVNDPELMRTALSRLRPLAAAGDFEGRQYAILYDRVAVVVEHRAQRFGTQLECRGGAWRPVKVEAPAALEARRRAVGLKETEGAYLASSAGEPCP